MNKVLLCARIVIIATCLFVAGCRQPCTTVISTYVAFADRNSPPHFFIDSIASTTPGTAQELKGKFIELEFNDTVLQKRFWKEIGDTPNAYNYLLRGKIRYLRQDDNHTFVVSGYKLTWKPPAQRSTKVVREWVYDTVGQDRIKDKNVNIVLGMEWQEYDDTAPGLEKQFVNAIIQFTRGGTVSRFDLRFPHDGRARVMEKQPYWQFDTAYDGHYRISAVQYSLYADNYTLFFSDSADGRVQMDSMMRFEYWNNGAALICGCNRSTTELDLSQDWYATVNGGKLKNCVVRQYIDSLTELYYSPAVKLEGLPEKGQEILKLRYKNRTSEIHFRGKIVAIITEDEDSFSVLHDAGYSIFGFSPQFDCWVLDRTESLYEERTRHNIRLANRVYHIRP